jgi:F1F0 ATPase subunit 2
MNDAFLIAALLFGISLGAVYFGGLWLTIILLPASRRRWPVIVLSYLVRIALTLAGFYSILLVDWKQFLVCGFGFFLVRQAIMHRMRAGGDAGGGDDDNP